MELKKGIEEAGREIVASLSTLTEGIEGKTDRVAEVRYNLCWRWRLSVS
jgi:hypothetical protein